VPRELRILTRWMSTVIPLLADAPRSDRRGGATQVAPVQMCELAGLFLRARIFASSSAMRRCLTRLLSLIRKTVTVARLRTETDDRGIRVDLEMVVPLLPTWIIQEGRVAGRRSSAATFGP